MLASAAATVKDLPRAANALAIALGRQERGVRAFGCCIFHGNLSEPEDPPVILSNKITEPIPFISG